MMEHEHRFVYLGVKYRISDSPIPGSGAHLREYFDVYFCEGCLEKRSEKLAAQNDTYCKPLFDATPMGKI